jgi:hypothetical protein
MTLDAAPLPLPFIAALRPGGKCISVILADWQRLPDHDRGLLRHVLGVVRPGLELLDISHKV